MAQYATLKAAINAVIKANGQKEITGTVLNEVLTSMVNSLGANYMLAGVATPSTNPGTPDQNVFYLAFEAGTYTNFNATVIPAGISILMWNGSWSSQTFYTIDATPTASSNNLISSGAVFDAIKTDGSAYDVSAHFPTGGPNSDGKFTLDYILANANILIPAAWRKGGMSIKFVQSSDNKYIQFRCMSDEWSIDTNDWALCSEDILIENPEFVRVLVDADYKIICAVKRDGTIFYGAGVPPQIIDYIQQKIEELSLDEYEDIVSFLQDYLGDETTLRDLLNTKVNVEHGKSLISSDVASNISYDDEEDVITTSKPLEIDGGAKISNLLEPEYLQVTTDLDYKILEGIKSEGTKVINLPIETLGTYIKYIEDEEWAEIHLDRDNKILYGVKKSGDFVFGIGVPTKIAEAIKEEISKSKKDCLYDVPEYYKEYIVGKMHEINNMNDESGINGDTFLFITDYHIQSNTRNSASLVKYLMANTGIRFIVFGGDTQDWERTRNEAIDKTVGFKNDFINVWDKVLPIIGNHEFNSHYYRVGETDDPNTMLFTNQIYNLIVKDKEGGFGWRNQFGDYYFDNPVQKIRYFVIGCHYECVVTPTQIRTIIEQFENVPDDYNIVVISHLTIQNDQYGISPWYSVRPILDALNALNNREVLNVEYTFGSYNRVYPTQGYEDIIEGGTFAFHADYTNSKAHAFVFIGGHMHDDIDLGYAYTGSYNVPIQVITTDCDAVGEHHRYVTDYGRVGKTISEQAFDVVHLDIENKIVYMKRIGGGYDRIYHTSPHIINVGESITLSPSLSGTIAWGINSTAYATMNNGVVTGVAEGSVFVSATNNSGERELFIIKVNV